MAEAENSAQAENQNRTLRDSAERHSLSEQLTQERSGEAPPAQTWGFPPGIQ